MPPPPLNPILLRPEVAQEGVVPQADQAADRDQVGATERGPAGVVVMGPVAGVVMEAEATGVGAAEAVVGLVEVVVREEAVVVLLTNVVTKVLKLFKLLNLLHSISAAYDSVRKG